ncbi:uncharacterized protein G2W53_029053 [Senna tora]|uniref:Uncharacterized protein n=1 Tax=Senna tora TaxID=362788 RepID=A0A834TDB5_9FABA|nr:uncharacterized protein G2W53_029053 [Senna tora]
MESTEAGKCCWNQPRLWTKTSMEVCREGMFSDGSVQRTDEGEPVKIWRTFRDNMVFSCQFYTFVAIFLVFHTKWNAWAFRRIQRIGFLAGIQFRAQQIEPNAEKHWEACNSSLELDSALNQT